MFEAVHGSAPDIAGQGIANPSGLLLAAVQMLVHLGEAETAQRIENAWLRTLERGPHTADLRQSDGAQRIVGTRAFAQAVIDNLGQEPEELAPAQYHAGAIQVQPAQHPRQEKQLVGVDAFLDWDEGDRDPERLGHRLETGLPGSWRLAMVTNRGVKVYPNGIPETFCTDHWRCRFRIEAGSPPVHALLAHLEQRGFDVVKTENLYAFDGEQGFSFGQGE